MSHHDPHKPTVSMDEQPDSWHMHTSEEGSPQEEHGAQANPAALVATFVGSVVFVGAVILATVMYYGAHNTRLREERIETTALAADYFQYRDRSLAVQADYGWSTPENAAAGKVTIPLDKAMERVRQQYAAGAPRAEGR
jgi:hypothetical protein